MSYLLNPYDWYSVKDNKTTIYATCFNESNDTVVLQINGYIHYCYILLPDGVISSALIAELKSLRTGSFIIKSEEVEKFPYTGYTTEKCRYLKIGSHNLKCINEIKYTLSKPYRHNSRVYSFELYITKLEPEVEFCNSAGLEMCGWLNVKQTSRTREIEQLSGILTVSTFIDLISKGSSSYIPVPKILSFDIEVANSMYLEMPDSMPKYSRLGDVPYVFGANVSTVDGITNYAFVCGDDSLKKRLNMKLLKNVNIKYYKTELGMFKGIAKWIKELQPNIIMGWNTYGFDWNYIFKRIKMLNEGDISFMLDLSFIDSLKATLIESIWESSAYGKQDMIYPRIPGILNIDLLKVIAREPTYRFEDNRLGTVSTALLGKTKFDMPIEDISKGYYNIDSGDALSKVILYCCQDTLLPIEIFNKLNFWINYREFSNVVNVPFDYLFVRGQQIKMLSTMYKLAGELGFMLKCSDKPRPVPGQDDDTEEETYSGGAVFDTKKGYWKNVVTVDFKSLYPSIILDKNICRTTHVDSKMWKKGDTEPDNESEIIDCNSITDSDCNVVYWEEEIETEMSRKARKSVTRNKPEKIFETMCFKHRFVKQEIREGLLPKIVAGWLDSRADCRNRQKKVEKNSMDWLILEGRQLAFKISANSSYGALGASKGYLPFPEGAASITGRGRNMIREVMSIIESEYHGIMVAGDTDSAMFTIPGKDHIETDILGKKIAKDISARLDVNKKNVIELQYEHLKYKYLGLGKKLYFYKTIDPVTGKVSELNSKGTAAVKRDRMEITRRLAKGVAVRIFDDLPESEINNYLVDSCKKIITRNADTSLLYTPMGIKDVYKNQNLAQARLRQKILDRDGEIISGDKFRTILVKVQGIKGYTERLGERVEFLDYYLKRREANNMNDEEQLILDYPCMFSKIVNAVSKIIQCAYNTENTSIDDLFTHIKLTQKLCKEIETLSEPCVFIMKDGLRRSASELGKQKKITSYRTATVKDTFINNSSSSKKIFE